MAKLNQIVAIEKGIKSRVYSKITELHKESQKTDLYTGFQKTYRKKDEEGEEFPPESRRVQLTANGVFVQLREEHLELFDIIAIKDYANCTAKANVEIGGQVIVKDAPVTYLLFLEKQITDLRTFVEKMPTLDESENWTIDPNTSMFRTETTVTHRTKKVQRPIVLYGATKEHPAQTQLISEDILVGYWDTIKMSGALPIPKKKEILTRIEALGNAVKMARETANNTDTPTLSVGEKVFDYLFT